MSFQYYNANPLGRHVNDCTVRAFSLATNLSWDEAFSKLSYYAQRQCIMPDEVEYIDGFLQENYCQKCGCGGFNYLLKDFLQDHPVGTYLVTMNGHITCCIDGVVYDTFDPSDRPIWDVYEVKKQRAY